MPSSTFRDRFRELRRAAGVVFFLRGSIGHGPLEFPNGMI
ncbi:hypothetical protein SAMCCGM7_pC0540 (plasmid) [Sinorhizobium americanum CCGM7]|nr:hypothetical protein SAMCCGM7_pC0540 [Sinorhizobium americanum CCGM7]